MLGQEKNEVCGNELSTFIIINGKFFWGWTTGQWRQFKFKAELSSVEHCYSRFFGTKENMGVVKLNKKKNDDFAKL